MAYTIDDAQLRLAQRLGESAVPSVTAESQKRREWFNEACEVLYTKKPLWFMETITTQATIADNPKYSFPSSMRRELLLYIDGFKYEKIDIQTLDDVRSTLHPVKVLYETYKYAYYTMGDYFYLIPTPTDSPTVYSVTSITRSGTTATVTTTDSHGLVTDDYVTIAGAGQADYNGKYQISYVSATVFTYTVANSPVTPATGTLTYFKDNIEVWYTKGFTRWDASTDSVSTNIPDKYMNLLVSYAEGRYWSTAHKRGKSSDAFTEYETILQDITAEDTRRKFKTGLI